MKRPGLAAATLAWVLTVAGVGMVGELKLADSGKVKDGSDGGLFGLFFEGAALTIASKHLARTERSESYRGHWPKLLAAWSGGSLAPRWVKGELLGPNNTV